MDFERIRLRSTDRDVQIAIDGIDVFEGSGKELLAVLDKHSMFMRYVDSRDEFGGPTGQEVRQDSGVRGNEA